MCEAVDISSNGVVQKVGGNQTAHSSPPGDTAQSWVLVVHPFNHKDPYTESGTETKREKNKMGTANKRSPLRSWPFYLPRLSKVGDDFIPLHRYNVTASISTILPLFRCILLT